MPKIRFSIFKFMILTGICMIIYNEYLCYVLNTITWPKFNCKHEDCVKLLLVADPQLIGENDESIQSLTPLTIFDSDRFLLNTYRLALQHVNPDIVIFLGDLFDEGLRATRLQFHHYVKRFFKIFKKEKHIKYVYLPGDNDIGGDLNFISKTKKIMFNKTFKTENLFDYKFLTFTNINRLTFNFYILNDKNYDDNISIAMSHLPLVLIPSLFVDKVLESVKPKLIFTAHEHRSMFVDTNIHQSFRKITKLESSESKPYEFVLRKDLVREIVVPTCSYRMGEKSTGYGFALIEKSGRMQYTVLWSPSRFSYIKAYAFYLILVLIILLLFIIRIFYRKAKYFISNHLYFKHMLEKNIV